MNLSRFLGCKTEDRIPYIVMNLHSSLPIVNLLTRNMPSSFFIQVRENENYRTALPDKRVMMAYLPAIHPWRSL